MTKEEIINGSKLIAEYMGMEYIPFSTDMKHKSAGWYQVKDATPTIEEVTQTAYKVGEEDKAVVTKFKMDTNKLKYHVKNGWNLVGEEGKNPKYYKFVCRTHGELRYFNSLDSLVPVIQKIEKEFGVTFKLYNGGAEVGNSYGTYDEQFELPNWSNNVFAVVLSFLSAKNENK